MFPHCSFRTVNCLLVILLLAGCSLPGSTPAATQPQGAPMESPVSNAIHTPTSTECIFCFPTATYGTIRFLNLSDGGSIAGSYDEQGRAQVMVQVEVSGANTLAVQLKANGLPQIGEVDNKTAQDPFLAEFTWYPLTGGGDYTLLVNAMLYDKTALQATAHVTVTGIPAFTPTPPPLDLASAQQRISEIIQQDYGVSIPKPTVYRADYPQYPTVSRWIGSAWYNGYFYYVDLYDDTHYKDWRRTPYADPSHRAQNDEFTYCRPVGHYRLLVLFVDYNHYLTDPQAALADVPPMVDWMNTLFQNFASSQGLSAAPMTLEVDAAVVSPPPEPGKLLTTDQVRSLTGKEPNNFDFFIEIDLDPNVSFSPNFPSGGGQPMLGCSVAQNAIISAWSSTPDDTNIQGQLVMDLNHELLHLFGMNDNWPFAGAAVIGPDGYPHDDWIPYPMLGWTDTDGDGIIEILDPTPYGTTGPQP